MQSWLIRKLKSIRWSRTRTIRRMRREHNHVDNGFFGFQGHKLSLESKGYSDQNCDLSKWGLENIHAYIFEIYDQAFEDPTIKNITYMHIYIYIGAFMHVWLDIYDFDFALVHLMLYVRLTTCTYCVYILFAEYCRSISPNLDHGHRQKSLLAVFFPVPGFNLIPLLGFWDLQRRRGFSNFQLVSCCWWWGKGKERQKRQKG